MKRSIMILLILYTTSLSFSQVADSLLLVDFENEADSLGEWTGSIGEGYIESLWVPDPTGESVGAIEVTIDGAQGNKGGFSHPNLNVIVDGDTATSFVAYVYLVEDYPRETGGVQIFAQARSNWNWQSQWYNTSELTVDVWNRLEISIKERLATVEEYDVSQGVVAGVEYVLPEGSDWFGPVYGDNLYLLGLSTATDVHTEHYQKPESFSLLNYPNPFNPSTTISYTLPAKQVVTVAIYDINGRLLQTLVDNEFQPGGRHALRFDASNLSSGVYFCKLTSGPHIQMVKMSLVR